MKPGDNNNAIIGNVEYCHPLILGQIFISGMNNKVDQTTAEEWVRRNHVNFSHHFSLSLWWQVSSGAEHVPTPHPSISITEAQVKHPLNKVALSGALVHVKQPVTGSVIGRQIFKQNEAEKRGTLCVTSWWVWCQCQTDIEIIFCHLYHIFATRCVQSKDTRLFA